MKLNRLILGTIIGTQFVFTCFAADDATTNSTEAAEIEALKQEVQRLDKKIENLENQHQTEQQGTANSGNEQVQELDQKVRILERERELDQQAASDAAKTAPRITLGASGFGFSSAD